MQGRALGSPQSSGTQRTGRRRLSSSDEGEPGQPCNQWPWGPEGRPSDSGTSRGVLAYRPAEPAGNRHNTYDDETYQRSDLPGGDPTARPREPVNLRPNKRWRAVYQIQAHMAQFREDPRKSGGAVSERARQNSVLLLASLAKPSLIMTGRGARTTTKGEP